MQSKQELEKWYEKVDAWNYQSNPDDIMRKEKILGVIGDYAEKNKIFKFNSALDVGAGEGWITSDIPAVDIFGIELSDYAAGRFPENVTRIHEPKQSFDLVLMTGVLYEQYDHNQFAHWALHHTDGLLVTCNILEWELGINRFGQAISEERFSYRGMTQHLCTFKISQNESN